MSERERSSVSELQRAADRRQRGRNSIVIISVGQTVTKPATQRNSLRALTIDDEKRKAESTAL